MNISRHLFHPWRESKKIFSFLKRIIFCYIRVLVLSQCSWWISFIMLYMRRYCFKLYRKKKSKLVQVVCTYRGPEVQVRPYISITNTCAGYVKPKNIKIHYLKRKGAMSSSHKNCEESLTNRQRQRGAAPPLTLHRLIALSKTAACSHKKFDPSPHVPWIPQLGQIS